MQLVSDFVLWYGADPFYMEDDDYSNVFKDNIDTELPKMEREIEQLENEKTTRVTSRAHA